MTAEPTPPTPVCCGQGRMAGWNGDPKEDSALRPACMLCPNSPTYWDLDGSKRARLVELYGH